MQDDPAEQGAPDDQPTYNTTNFLEDIFASIASQVTTFLIHSAYYTFQALHMNLLTTSGVSESELLFLLQDFNPDATLFGEEY
jgi:hypothetical protein